MATIIFNPKITFIHIPKCAGNSVTAWMKKNFNAKITKKKQHATVDQVIAGKSHTLGPIEDLGFKFCIVRNPFDYLVSFYEFRRRLCIQRIDMLSKNPRLINLESKKFNLQGNKDALKRLNDIGFEGWLHKHHIRPMHHWAKDCDLVLKLENITEDFKIIQDMLNCYEPLPHNNSGGIRHPDYRKYYTKQQSIDFVEKNYVKDINYFNYSF